MKNKMSNKIFTFYIFASIVYASQGITSLFSQIQYYFLREHSGLSLTQISLIGFIIGIPWVIKMFLSLLIDFFPIKGYSTKYYIWIDCVGLLIAYCGMIIFGLHIWSFLLFGFLINLFTSLNDISQDRTMVIYERKFDLKGKGICVQWSALAIVGLFTSLVGAKLSETMNYQVAYSICLIFPILLMLYLKFLHKEEKVEKQKIVLKNLFKYFKDKQFLLGLAFIACLQLTPSFGLGLMAEMRENMGVSKMFVGLLGSVGTVFGLLGYILYFKFGSKFSLKRILFYSLIFSAISNLFYLYIPTQWHIMGYHIIFGAFSGICFMAIMTFMSNITPKGVEATLFACVTALANLCSNGSGILSGILYDNWGYSLTVIISSILTVFCLFFIPFLKIYEKN